MPAAADRVVRAVKVMEVAAEEGAATSVKDNLARRAVKAALLILQTISPSKILAKSGTGGRSPR